jgi:hypothetical protein
MKRLFFTSIIISLSLLSISQGAIQKNTKLSDKFFFGGGLGLQFGTITSIQVEPMVGYKPIEKLYTGLKISYSYYADNYYNYYTHVFGGSLMAFYAFQDYLSFYTEFEVLNLSTDFDIAHKYPDQSRFWIGTPLVGLGYSQPLGDRSRLVLLILFDVVQAKNSPYSNPIIRMTYLF